MNNWKWNSTYDEAENLDWLILRDGPISKYFSHEILNKDIKSLVNVGYNIIDVNLKNWTISNYQSKMKDAFEFPQYYGENLAAFGDCLGDLFNNKTTGLVIVFRQFDAFYENSKDVSESILEIIINESWTWLLTGKKLITLIQVDDPDFHIDKIGGFSPSWNGKEWLNSNRTI